MGCATVELLYCNCLLTVRIAQNYTHTRIIGVLRKKEQGFHVIPISCQSTGGTAGTPPKQLSCMSLDTATGLLLAHYCKPQLRKPEEDRFGVGLVRKLILNLKVLRHF